MSLEQTNRILQKIAIFGGSFDPVHNGHVLMAESALKSGLCDRILILPAMVSPFKANKKSESFEHRFKMCRLAFKHLDAVRISNIERSLPQPSYTIQTLEKLQDKEPDSQLLLLIGADNLAHFHKWKDYGKILAKCRLLVARRPGYETSTVSKEILDKTSFIAHEPVPHSSTEARNAFSVEEDSYSVPELVNAYINKHGLYKSKG